MNVVKLVGGLGNQMFQYAFGVALGDDTLFDVSWFDTCEGGTPRKYGLGDFNCAVKFLRDVEWHHKYLRIGHGFWRKKIRFEYENNATSYNPKYRTFKNKCFHGYFQNEKYFLCIRDRILKDFTPKEEDCGLLHFRKMIDATNSVSVHVRRGDYVKLQHFHGLCGLDYYQCAIERIAQAVSSPKFFIFSDDIEWCRQNLSIKYPHEFVSDPSKDNPICDMMLMKTCKHNIIANSSYSWWGAWLNENPDKIVIAPKQWFADGRDTDIVPADWIKM